MDTTSSDARGLERYSIASRTGQGLPANACRHPTPLVAKYPGPVLRRTTNFGATLNDRFATLRVRLATYVTCLRFVTALATTTVLSSCGGDSTASYALNVYVSGLTGSGLQVTLNGGAPISISANSQTTIARLPNGTSYTVAINAQPLNPAQICSAAKLSGKISSNNADVMMNCIAASPFQTVNANVSIDSSIPAAVTQTIATLVSPAGIANLGSRLPVSSALTTWECLIYAVDANDNIVLAAMVTSNTVVLSADSTALALVRLLLGPLPSGLAANDVNAAIRATNDYVTLVTTITQSLQSGATDTASAPVLTAANLVATELPSGVLSQFAGIAGTRKQVKALSPPTTTQAPFTLLSWDSKGVESVVLTGAASDYSAQVANGMPIAWGFASSDFEGQPICETGKSPGAHGTCVVVVAGAGIGHQLLDLYATLVGGSASSLFSQEVPADGGTPFYLTIEQNSESRGANAVQIVKDVVSYALTAATAGTANAALGKCVDSLVETFMPSAQLGALVADASPTSFEDYLQAIPKEFTEQTIVGDLAQCLGETPAPSTHGMPQYVRITAIFFRKLGTWVTSNIGKPIQAANTALRVGLAIEYWNYPGQKFGVCEASGLLGNTIVSCAVSFQFTPSSLLMSPGAVAKVTLSAQDGSNPPQSTSVPNDTTFSPDDSSVATVSGGPTTVTVTAQLGAGRSTNISADEIATGATGKLSVAVVLPAVQPTSATVAPGQSVTLTLADPNGNSVIVPAATLWSTIPSPQSVFNLDIISGLFTGPSQARFVAAADALIGQSITVTATDPSGISFGQSVLTIGVPNKLAGKWLDSFGNPWTINADGLTGTFEIFDAQPSPCYDVALPVTIQVTGSNFVATALLPGNGQFPCYPTWVDALTLDPSGFIAQGTFTTGINHGPQTWTRASGPVVVVPNVVGYGQAYATTVFPRASLHVGTVTTQVNSTLPVGTIVSTSPAVLSSVAAGSAVNLIIAIH